LLKHNVGKDKGEDKDNYGYEDKDEDKDNNEGKDEDNDSEIKDSKDKYITGMLCVFSQSTDCTKHFCSQPKC
jgi:hypothetical protein